MLVRRGKCVSFAPGSMAEDCIICGCSSSKLALLAGQPYIVLPIFRITNQFWRLQLRANFLKVPQNIIAIAELNSPTREICRPTTSHLIMQQLELHLEATEMEISQTPWFCLINACFVKSQSTSQTRRPERSFTVCSMKKKACAFLRVK